MDDAVTAQIPIAIGSGSLVGFRLGLVGSSSSMLSIRLVADCNLRATYLANL
jgi:hypothetical protein